MKVGVRSDARGIDQELYFSGHAVGNARVRVIRFYHVEHRLCAVSQIGEIAVERVQDLLDRLFVELGQTVAELNTAVVELLRAILKDKLPPSLPVICGADFGHVLPIMTFPVGGRVRLRAEGEEAAIVFESR